MNDHETESIFDDFVRRELTYRGAKISLLLGTPSKGDSLGIIRAVGRYFEKFGGEAAKIEGETDEQRADRQEADLVAWDEYCEKKIVQYVSLEKPVKRRLKPGAEPVVIDSPEELVKSTDRSFCTLVVMALHSLCLLGDSESKSSGSPSTSTAESAGLPTSPSPVTSTPISVMPSTATDSLETVPSSPAA